MASSTAFYAGRADAAASVPAVWHVPVSERLGGEYVPLMQDALRMLCIQATIQLMGYLSQPAGGAPAVPLLSADFLLLLVYVLLGVMLYWLAARRMVAFV